MSNQPNAQSIKDRPDLDDEIPEGMEPLSSKQVDGWFSLEKGNVIQGFLLAKVKTSSNFDDAKDKMFFKVEITKGNTKALDTNKKPVSLGVGKVVGLDAKGFLAALKDVEDGREIWVKYLGLQDKASVKKGRSPAHLFKVAAVPV